MLRPLPFDVSARTGGEDANARKKNGNTGTPLPKREAMSESGIAGRLRKACVGQFAGSSVRTASYLSYERKYALRRDRKGNVHLLPDELLHRKKAI